MDFVWGCLEAGAVQPESIHKTSKILVQCRFMKSTPLEIQSKLLNQNF